jgi:ABC-type branched-subunit amino acid transport system substrate-binding protein
MLSKYLDKIENNKIIYFLILVIIILVIFFWKKKKIIKVGVLFTTSGGVMEKDEKNLYDTIIENIDLYNSIQNKIHLEKVVFNPGSDTNLYTKGAEYLCSENVALIFGCWRSSDRVAIKPIIEKNNNLLCYPLQYEGNECSKNILYFGACPNQQIDIGTEYAIKNISNNVFLIGSDYIFPRTANKIVKNYITNLNGKLLGEIYVSMDETKFDGVVNKIFESLKDDKPVLIINTLNGDSNKYFFETLYNKFKENPKNANFIVSDKFPVMSFSLTIKTVHEEYKPEWMYNNYFVWNFNIGEKNYDTFLNNAYPNNNNNNCNLLIQNFVKNIKQILINKKNYISDPMYHVFLSFLFFINFLEKYDGSYDSKNIRDNYLKNNNSLVLTPTGYLSILENHHLEQPAFILKYDTKSNVKRVVGLTYNVSPNPFFDKFKNNNNKANETNNHLNNHDFNNYFNNHVNNHVNHDFNNHVNHDFNNNFNNNLNNNFNNNLNNNFNNDFNNNDYFTTNLLENYYTPLYSKY